MRPLAEWLPVATRPAMDGGARKSTDTDVRLATVVAGGQPQPYGAFTRRLGAKPALLRHHTFGAGGLLPKNKARPPFSGVGLGHDIKLLPYQRAFSSGGLVFQRLCSQNHSWGWARMCVSRMALSRQVVT